MSESLLPESSGEVFPDFQTSSDDVSKTFRIAYERESQFAGMTDELDAMRQAIYKIINTERYEYIIYSWNYGIELADLFGKPVPFVYAELPRRITEALMQDDRILSVGDFRMSYNKKGDVLAEFTVHTIYGDVDASKGVNASV
ncbi:MAG: DUF2634 domain-containing protein [Selenomonadaceae bacterium]|nr:DUF2634 domain-containing protein [Selenomonadaceae bacterium]